MSVDTSFTHSLPKAELHAHLSGSISRATLHSIWQDKQQKSALDPSSPISTDPAIALKPAGTYPTIHSFFRLFNDYIYHLLDDAASIALATRSVAQDFRNDGVRYLELRTTPRAIPAAGMDREEYVRVVLDALRQYHAEQASLPEAERIEVHLILSIDRTMTAAEAEEILSIAAKHQQQQQTPPASTSTSTPIPPPSILALDLCGNPSKGDISTFTPTFHRALTLKLHTTVHIGEIPTTSTSDELTTLLSWHPSRLGHAIHLPTALKETIKSRHLPLELCLSCNVLAGMTAGGFGAHHFREWWAGGGGECPVALSTDDVGVFESPLSAEYALAARAFGLGRAEVVRLARCAVGAAFAGRERMGRLIGEFEEGVVGS